MVLPDKVHTILDGGLSRSKALWLNFTRIAVADGNRRMGIMG